MPPDFRQDPRSNHPPGFRDIQQEDAPAGVIHGLLLMIALAIAVMVGIAAHDLWKKAHRMPKEGQSGEGVLSYPSSELDRPFETTIGVSNPLQFNPTPIPHTLPGLDRPTAGFSGREIGPQP